MKSLVEPPITIDITSSTNNTTVALTMSPTSWARNSAEGIFLIKYSHPYGDLGASGISFGININKARIIES